jgi:hypothetical protein
MKGRHQVTSSASLWRSPEVASWPAWGRPTGVYDQEWCQRASCELECAGVRSTEEAVWVTVPLGNKTSPQIKGLVRTEIFPLQQPKPLGDFTEGPWMMRLSLGGGRATWGELNWSAEEPTKREVKRGLGWSSDADLASTLVASLLNLPADKWAVPSAWGLPLLLRDLPGW